MSQNIVSEIESDLLINKVPSGVRALEHCLSLHLLRHASCKWEVDHNISARWFKLIDFIFQSHSTLNVNLQSHLLTSIT